MLVDHTVRSSTIYSGEEEGGDHFSCSQSVTSFQTGGVSGITGCTCCSAPELTQNLIHVCCILVCVCAKVTAIQGAGDAASVMAESQRVTRLATDQSRQLGLQEKIISSLKKEISALRTKLSETERALQQQQSSASPAPVCALFVCLGSTRPHLWCSDSALQVINEGTAVLLQQRCECWLSVKWRARLLLSSCVCCRWRTISSRKQPAAYARA